MKKKVLVTGSAGFIGYHVSKKLLESGWSVFGIDNLNSYYSVQIKKNRIRELTKNVKFIFKKIDLINYKEIYKLVSANNIKIIVHLAAQAGVRYSITNPMAYVKSNLIGFTNILEVSRRCNCKHLIYASTSSVYGASINSPYKENNVASHPVAFYGATKRSNELMAHSYSYMYKLPTTGLRFFTVYGPWGRPDMSLFIFVKNILNNKPINIFNRGDHTRDFTYVEDVSESIKRLINKPPKITKKNKFDNPSTSSAPYRILNIGNSKKINLMQYVRTIEEILKKKAKIKFLPMQKGDIKSTLANNLKVKKLINFSPNTKISVGIKKFINWYLNYFKK